MKAFFITTILFFSGLIVNAQETFFPTKEGIVLTYKNFDKKNKLTSEVKYTVKQVKESGNDVDITYLCESLDSKGKLVFNEEITMHQKGDILYFDMSNFINKAAFQKNGEIPADVTVKGNNMEIPLNPQPGQALPDASVEMSMKMGFVNMKIGADVTNRKVEDIEDVLVPAGNFKCYRFSGDVTAVALGIKSKVKSIEWYAKGIGTVKMETFDKNGSLTSTTELVDISK